MKKPLTPNHFFNTRVVYFDAHGIVASVQECLRRPMDMREPTTFQSLERSVCYEVSSKFFTPNGVALPISEIIEAFKAGTWDCVEKDRWVDRDSLKIDFGDYRVSIVVHAYQPHGNIRGDRVEAWLNSIPPEIVKYLLAQNPIDKAFNYIPAGFGWDGSNSHLELYHMFKMRQLLIGNHRWDINADLIHSLSQQYVFSTSALVNTDWDKASICEKGGSIEVGQTTPTGEIYVFVQNDTFSKLFSSDSDLHSFTIPEGFDRAVVVKTNMITKSSRSYGLAVDLYKEAS